MTTIFREIIRHIRTILDAKKSILLLGPRQTGKTTLLAQLKADLVLNLSEPRLRQQYERDAQVLADQIDQLVLSNQNLPLIVIDEIQKVPELLDVIQVLIDQKKAQFILIGSSARKLRRQQSINLLPGRIVVLKLDPLSITETAQEQETSLIDRLTFGDLPEIRTLALENGLNPEINHLRNQLLDSYVSTYLEEEIRAEAVVRNTVLFSRFLELAAIESGQILNFSKMAQDLGVTTKTVQSYYEILDDCLIADRIMPHTMGTTRKRLSKSPKYLLFDMGVRRLAAREGAPISSSRLPALFEQWIGLQLIRRCKLSYARVQVKYWRDHNGPEVDWILDFQNKLVPIEVKWTTTPTLKDCRHLVTFCEQYSQSTKGYVVCRIPEIRVISDLITAIPWQKLDHVFDY